MWLDPSPCKNMGFWRGYWLFYCMPAQYKSLKNLQTHPRPATGEGLEDNLIICLSSLLYRDSRERAVCCSPPLPFHLLQEKYKSISSPLPLSVIHFFSISPPQNTFSFLPSHSTRAPNFQELALMSCSPLALLPENKPFLFHIQILFKFQQSQESASNWKSFSEICLKLKHEPHWSSIPVQVKMEVVRRQWD